jgi:hypothetical protein
LSAPRVIGGNLRTGVFRGNPLIRTIFHASDDWRRPETGQLSRCGTRSRTD